MKAWEDLVGGELTPAEVKLIEACLAGQPCVLGENRPDKASEDREIRAPILKALITGGLRDQPTTDIGVHLEGAYISGVLNLLMCRAKGLTGLFNCRLDNGIDAFEATFEALNLSGSEFLYFMGQGARIRGNLFITSASINGQVSISAATIGGQLAFAGTRIVSDTGVAVAGEGVSIGSGAFFHHGFFSHGEVNLARSTIRGTLEFQTANIHNPNKKAINASGSRITSNVRLGDGSIILGEVDFSAAKIEGQTSVDNQEIYQSQSYALNFQSAQLGMGAIVNNVSTDKEISFATSAIEGQLGFSNLWVDHYDGRAINLQKAAVRNDLIIGPNVNINGEIRLIGADISGQLSLVKLKVKSKCYALNMQDTHCRNTFILHEFSCDNGIIDLSGANVGTLCDDLKSWPEDARVILNGFTYDRISGAPTDSKARLAWLARGDRLRNEFFPQPYTQLAKVLRNMGHERGARDVLVARDRKIAAEEWTRAYQSLDGTWTKAWASLGADLRAYISFISRLFFGYGHRREKAVLLLPVFGLIAAALAHCAWEAGDMVPNSDVILTSENWAVVYEPDHPAIAWGETPEGQSWESFCSLVWGLDLVVPILDLGQTQAWTPSTNLGFAGQFLWVAKPILTILGWIVLAIAAAGVTDVARRD